MIREIERGDIPACAALIRESFRTVADEFGFTEENAPGFTAFSVTEETLLRHFAEGRPMFARIEDGRIAGYCSLLIQGESCELNHLCTAPGSRHRGIGRALFAHACGFAARKGCRLMRIGIVEENRRLRQWYEALGARHVGTEKFAQFPFTCGCLEKELSCRPVLHLMVGLPGSGKTTFARAHAKEWRAAVLTPDVWQTALFGDDFRGAEDSAEHDARHTRIEGLLWDLAAQLLAGEDEDLSLWFQTQYAGRFAALAAQAARPGGLLLSATSMGAGRQELMERVTSMTSPKQISKLAVSLTLALSLLVGTAAFTTAAQSGNGYLPRQVQPDPALTVTALDPTVVPIPDFDWTGGRGSYEAEILIRWMSAYGQQFYALPEGHPWKAGDVWVVPNVFYGRGNGILGGAGEKDGTDLNVVDLTGKNRYAGTWVTLAIKPAGGIQAVEPLFQGGVPRGTEAFADYVLLQYHVQLICEAGDGQWRHRFSSPSWNTLPPGDPETWTAEQLALWESNLPWGMSMNMEDDTAASRQKAGEDWAESYANHFLTAPNNGNPLKADDVRVGSVTLLSQTADTLSFRVELAFRPIWGTEGAMAFCTLQYGADACALGTGELEGYVTLTLPLTMKRDTDRTSPWIWWTGVRPD